jgi:thiosulfate dehydrogenase
LCHGSKGEGIKKSKTNSYEYPPLWGSDSYNNGAGMSRVITAAQFIKGNMPYGVTYKSPMLSDGDAYDVAGYINQQKRPIKVNLELDFPDLKRKPVSTPYPPYVDTFSISEHQLGPFQPIIAFYKQKFNLIKNK